MDGYIFDYRAGYVRDGCAMTGFDVIGGDDAPGGRIVLLGGYTTPEMAAAGQSPANALYDRTGGEYQILSGCTDGYATAGMLTLLIRDVILFEPKLVVCLSGFYNLAYKLGLVENKADAEFLMTHPFATPGHLYFYRKITSRFGLGNDEVFYGEENGESASRLWLRQIAEMNAICGEFGIKLQTLLQPCVFSGKYARSERESAFLRDYYGLTDSGLDDFHAAFQREYAEITDAAKGLGYITDLSGLFDGEADIYADAVHVRDEFLPALTEVMA